MRRKICTLIHSVAAYYSGPIFCVYGIILIVISKLIILAPEMLGKRILKFIPFARLTASRL